MNERTDAELSSSAEDEVQVSEPAILVRINRLYTPDAPAEELYDTTRGVWRVSERRERARYALAVYHGEIIQVYTITAWHPAGSTKYVSRVIDKRRYGGRWEFTGEVAPNPVRDRHVGRSVAHYFARGNANPIMYVNC